jgi:hypothetical protein
LRRLISLTEPENRRWQSAVSLVYWTPNQGTIAFGAGESIGIAN